MPGLSAPCPAAGSGRRAGGAFPIPSPTGNRARADLEHGRRRRRKLKAQGQRCLLSPPVGLLGPGEMPLGPD